MRTARIVDHIHTVECKLLNICIVAVLINGAGTTNLGKHAIANCTTRWNIVAALQCFKTRYRQVSLPKEILTINDDTSSPTPKSEP